MNERDSSNIYHFDSEKTPMNAREFSEAKRLAIEAGERCEDSLFLHEFVMSEEKRISLGRTSKGRLQKGKSYVCNYAIGLGRFLKNKEAVGILTGEYTSARHLNKLMTLKGYLRGLGGCQPGRKRDELVARDVEEWVIRKESLRRGVKPILSDRTDEFAQLGGYKLGFLVRGLLRDCRRMQFL